MMAFSSYTLFLICLYLGYDSLIQKQKTILHKFYLFLIALYCFWNLGMTFFYSIGTKEVALFIFNISSNWIALLTLPLFLHFTLLFTRTYVRLQQRWLIYTLIYLPYFIIQILSLFPQLTWVDTLVWTDYGWHIKARVFSIPNLILMCYMSVIFLCGFSNIILWGHRSGSKKVKKQAILLSAASLTGSIFSTLSYVLWGLLQSIDFPYTNHFATFFLAIGFKLAISRYQFMKVGPQVALHDILNNIEDFFLLYDMQGNIMTSNKRINEILGYTEEDIKNDPIDIMYENKRIDLVAFIKELETDRAVSFESVIISKSRAHIPVRLYITTIQDNYDEAIGRLVIGHDERIKQQLDLERRDKRKKEKSLEASEEQYRKTINSLTDFIYVIDKKYRLILYNEACEKYAKALGITTRLMGKVIFDVFPYLTHKSKDEYEAIFKTGNRSITRNSIELNNNMMFFESRKIPIVENNKVQKIISIVRDMTDQKRAEENLIQTTRLDSLGILAGGIAHDFNNALTSIITNVTFATTYLKEKDIKEISTILTETTNAAMQARNLTLQLLTFAKGGIHIKKVGPIQELLKETAFFSLRGSNCSVSFQIDDSLKMVDMDSGQLASAFQNILINARESMPGGGDIVVGATNIELPYYNPFNLKHGNYVKISIEDNGKGIDPLIINRIFDPYFSTKEDGHGLGLATAFTIVRNHNGYIDVQSVPDKGSTFHIYLPATDKEEKTEPSFIHEKDLKNINVLLLEDDEFIQNVVARVIKHLAGNITITAEGEKTIRAYKKAMEENNPFDVVLLDLTIQGGMGGKEAIQHLLQIDKKVKGIVCSGYSTDPVIAHYSEYGFQYYLKKPFDVSELLRVLYIVLKKGNNP